MARRRTFYAVVRLTMIQTTSLQVRHGLDSQRTSVNKFIQTTKVAAICFKIASQDLLGNWKVEKKFNKNSELRERMMVSRIQHIETYFNIFQHKYA